jgi:glycosyltransferase involved in cell wall biosynthesis
MNIAYLSTFYPYRGGISQFNALLLNELQRNHNAKAFTFSTQYPNVLFPGSSQFVDENDSIEKIEAPRLLNTVNPFSYITTAYKISNFQPDLIITKFWLPFFGPSLGTVYKLQAIKTKRLAILDNVIPHEKRPGDKLFTKYFLNQCDYFVAMSENVKDDLLSLKPNANVIKLEHPLYNHFGAKLERKVALNQLGLNENKKYLLFFGFIRDYKGLDLILKSLLLISDEYELIIAGETYSSFEKYDSIINELGIEKRIKKFVRYINDNEVPLFFSAADVCVLPYKSATQSGIVGISHHFDLPIVATNVGGLEEVIGNNYTGIVVDEVSSESIAKGVNNYFASNIDFKENIKESKTRLSWENFANNMLEFIR